MRSNQGILDWTTAQSNSAVQRASSFWWHCGGRREAQGSGGYCSGLEKRQPGLVESSGDGGKEEEAPQGTLSGRGQVIGGEGGQTAYVGNEAKATCVTPHSPRAIQEITGTQRTHRVYENRVSPFPYLGRRV